MAIFSSPDDLDIAFTHLRNERLREANQHRAIRIARSRTASGRPRPTLPRLRRALTGVFSWHPTLSPRSSSAWQTAPLPDPAPPETKP